MNPLGITILLGVLAVGTNTGRGIVRTIVRASVLAGYTAKESIAELTENSREHLSGMLTTIKADIAEVKTEVETKGKAKKPHKRTVHDSDTSENYV